MECKFVFGLQDKTMMWHFFSIWPQNQHTNEDFLFQYTGHSHVAIILVEERKTNCKRRHSMKQKLKELQQSNGGSPTKFDS